MSAQTDSRKANESLRINWFVLFGLWSIYGACYANQTFFSMQARGMDHAYGWMVVWGVLVGNVWALITLAVLVLSRNFPLERPHIWRSSLAHVVGFLWTALVSAAGIVALTMLIRPFDPLTSNAPFDDQFLESLRSTGPYTLFVYGMIVGVGHALEYRRSAREREIEASRLEALLAKAQMASLKMQLHPHFLFNTLNGIVALVRSKETDRAVAMLMGLSGMLRVALESSESQEVTLREEIDFLRLYLDIEQMRFSDRLQTSIEIDPGTADARVPSLLLQPLVENAIRHGAAMKLTPTTISVSASRTNGTLTLQISDDGAGLRPDFDIERSSGIGLSNSVERLRHLYGDEQSLTVSERRGGGVNVVISLPFGLQQQNHEQPA